MMNVQLIPAISFMHTHTLSMTSDPEKSFIIYTTGEHRKKIFPGKKYQVFDLLVITSQQVINLYVEKHVTNTVIKTRNIYIHDVHGFCRHLSRHDDNFISVQVTLFWEWIKISFCHPRCHFLWIKTCMMMRLRWLCEGRVKVLKHSILSLPHTNSRDLTFVRSIHKSTSFCGTSLQQVIYKAWFTKFCTD